ncbi:MAG: 30S ribosomal protein S12 methylthiotransferase RimO [Bacillota bacterium]|nr:30S ribosomal protein S12 methylthiotransferase RimO [Bacillota bacterium]
MNVGFISLGCSKNRVDTEIMIGILKKAGYKIVSDPRKAELVIINTCGFITEAKEEAIQTILDTARLKEEGILQYLLATGCLAQRYPQDLFDELPELDAIVGISAFIQIDKIVEKVLRGERVWCVSSPSKTFIEKGPRVLTTPKGAAYLKIGEGCNNWCSYCAIPSIRGNLRSRPVVELVDESKQLVQDGVRELTLIAQDTANYGQDLTDGSHLVPLVKALDRIDDLEWIRLMYLHPAHIPNDLVECFTSCKKLVPYVDIPIQHVSDRILKSMNRHHSGEYLYKFFRKLKDQIPDLVLRTTVMVGFPGETEEDFTQLFDFVQEMEFDWLGVFCFDPEEGTKAFSMEQQVPEEVKIERRDKIMRLQKRISRSKNMQRVGTKERVLVSSKVSKNLWIGRTAFQAPEVDGITMIKSDRNLIMGNFENVAVKGIREYDLIGELEDEHTK